MTTTVVSCVYNEYQHHYNNMLRVLIYIIYHVIYYIILLYHGKGVVQVIGTLKTSYFTRERNDIVAIANNKIETKILLYV